MVDTVSPVRPTGVLPSPFSLRARRQVESFAPTVGFVTGFLESFEELTVALFVGGGLKTTLPKQMWDGILLQVNPIIAAASVVVLSVVILMFATVEYIRVRRTAGRSHSLTSPFW
jgi:ABC-type Fe3+ transport system permease subunit